MAYFKVIEQEKDGLDIKIHVVYIYIIHVI